MFFELDNIHVLLRLGGAPRIALQTAGHQGLSISICKNKVNVVVVVVVVVFVCN